MVKEFFITMLHKIVTFFIGQSRKGQPADYPKNGELKIQSTCMPNSKGSFNDWVDNLEKVKTGK